MKRLTVATILAGMLFILSPQNTPAQKSNDNSMTESLQLLGKKLERFGNVRVSYGIESPGRVTYEKIVYLGSEGCMFRYRVNRQEINTAANIENARSSFEASEWSIDLSQIDPERIEIETKKDWTGGFVNFYTLNGTDAIKFHNSRGGYRANVNYSHGGFAVSDSKASEELASDFRRAVCLCKEVKLTP